MTFQRAVWLMLLCLPVAPGAFCAPASETLLQEVQLELSKSAAPRMRALRGVLDTDTDTLRKKHYFSQWIVPLAGARWHAQVSFSPEAKPYLVMHRADKTEFFLVGFDDLAGPGGVRLPQLGAAERSYRLLLQEGPRSPEDRLDFLPGDPDHDPQEPPVCEESLAEPQYCAVPPAPELSFTYGDLLEGNLRSSQRLEPFGDRFAFWAQYDLDLHENQPATQSFYVLERRSDGYGLCVIPFSSLPRGKPALVGLGGLDAAFLLDPLPRPGNFRVRVWRGDPVPDARLRASCFDLGQRNY